MSAPQSPPVRVGLRWARALVVAMLAWGTSSAGHILAGGEIPPLRLVVALVAVTAWPLSMALRTRAGGLRMVTLLGVGQAAMHSALVVSSWGAGPAPRVDSHGGMAEMHSAQPMLAPAHAMSLLPGPDMILAHVVAAVLFGLILADAERALFGLLGLLLSPVINFGLIRRVLALVWGSTGPMDDAVTGAGGDVAVAIRRLRQRLLGAATGRRGPPVLV